MRWTEGGKKKKKSQNTNLAASEARLKLNPKIKGRRCDSCAREPEANWTEPSNCRGAQIGSLCSKCCIECVTSKIKSSPKDERLAPRGTKTFFIRVSLKKQFASLDFNRLDIINRTSNTGISLAILAFGI